VIAPFVAHEYESFRDIIREFGEALYGFRTRGIEAGDVDREVGLKVGDLEREWIYAVALCAGICCETGRAVSRLAFLRWGKVTPSWTLDHLAETI
jgi:hypothetical protein